MKNLILILLALFLMNCTSDDSKPTDESGLLGKWKLIEQLSDPGDGSGVFQPIESDRIIEFFSNDIVEVNGELCFMASEVGETTTGTYKKTSDNNSDTQNDGEIIPNTCSGKVYFDLPASGHLILWYPCIEPCVQKFVKI